MAGFMGPENPSKAERDRLTRLRTGTPTATVDAAPAATANPTGYDLSSNNSAAQFADALTRDFVIVKASEGVTYTNQSHDGWVQQARDKGLLIGHYHYARPESNGPAAESKAFLAAAKAQPGDVMVLDFEPPSIMPAYPSWAIAFSNEVTAATGAPCWFYTNQSQGNSMVSLSGSDQKQSLFKMPLWKAYYQSAIGDLMGWPTWACWQKTSTPIDTNEFNGDAAKWRALGVPGGTMALTQADVDMLLDAPIVRQPGNDPKKTTSLRAVAAWSDNNLGNISGQVKAVADAVKALPAPAAIDYAALAKAVNDDAAARREGWT